MPAATPPPPPAAAPPTPPAPPANDADAAPAPNVPVVPRRRLDDGGTDGPPAPPAHERTSDDPLSDTPEFLQETPDHDRLWFEQKPPRDFDF